MEVAATLKTSLGLGLNFNQQQRTGHTRKVMDHNS